jgi:hypothetical protein
MEVTLKSKLNNHTVDELQTFGSFLLSKIRGIDTSKDERLKEKINEAFETTIESKL